MLKQILGSVALAGVMVLSNAQATVIDFTLGAEGGTLEYTAQSDNGPQSYTAQGYKFDSVGDEGHLHDGYYGFGTVLMHDNSSYQPDTWVLTRVGGGTFDLTSFTAIDGNNLHWFTNLNAAGADAINGVNALNQFGISSLSFRLINGDNFAGLDQIVVNANTTDVPEPATLALFGMGLFGLGVARRKRS